MISKASSLGISVTQMWHYWHEWGQNSTAQNFKKYGNVDAWIELLSYNIHNISCKHDLDKWMTFLYLIFCNFFFQIESVDSDWVNAHHVSGFDYLGTRLNHQVQFYILHMSSFTCMFYIRYGDRWSLQSILCFHFMCTCAYFLKAYRYRPNAVR